MDLRNTIDNLMKERTTARLAKKKNQALIISYAMEELLWEKKILGEENPLHPLWTVVFLIGLVLMLRGKKEHCNLRRFGCDSQFEFSHNEDGVECIIFTEDALQKNNQGGLNDDNAGEGKTVYIYANPNPQHDPIRLIKKYKSLLPKKDEL